MAEIPQKWRVNPQISWEKASLGITDHHFPTKKKNVHRTSVSFGFFHPSSQFGRLRTGDVRRSFFIQEVPTNTSSTPGDRPMMISNGYGSITSKPRDEKTFLTMKPNQWNFPAMVKSCQVPMGQKPSAIIHWTLRWVWGFSSRVWLTPETIYYTMKSH